MMPCMRVWPRPRGSCRCTKAWVPSYPDLCTGSCSLPNGKGLPEGCCDSRLRLNKTVKKTSRQVIEKYYSSTEDQDCPCRQASYRQGAVQASGCPPGNSI